MNRKTKHLIQLREVLNQKSVFPIGMLVYFGPDNVTISKIIAAVILAKDSNPILRSWEGIGIGMDLKASTEIGQFFKDNHVVDIIMPDGVVGCPHEEGVDYPIGDNCPHCPFWAEN
jgi:hypothetical protein